MHDLDVFGLITQSFDFLQNEFAVLFLAGVLWHKISITTCLPLAYPVTFCHSIRPNWRTRVGSVCMPRQERAECSAGYVGTPREWADFVVIGPRYVASDIPPVLAALEGTKGGAETRRTAGVGTDRQRKARGCDHFGNAKVATVRCSQIVPEQSHCLSDQDRQKAI